MVKCETCGQWRPLFEIQDGWCSACRANVERLLRRVFPEGLRR
jgi:hypothetical protein